MAAGCGLLGHWEDQTLDCAYMLVFQAWVFFLYFFTYETILIFLKFFLPTFSASSASCPRGVSQGIRATCGSPGSLVEQVALQGRGQGQDGNVA